MPPFLWLALVVRVLANPCSNALQKLLAGRGLSPLVIIGAAHLGLSLVVLPGLLSHPLPRNSELWLNLGISAVLATLANVLIVYAVHRSDLSLVGPINAYKPIVSLVPSLVLLGEVPSLTGLAGIGLVVAGSGLLGQRPVPGAARPSWAQLFLHQGVQLRLAALIPSAFEAVFLKRALAVATPSTVFAWWAVLGWVAVLVALTVTRRWREVVHHPTELRTSLGTLLALVVTTGLMQLCTLITLATLPVGYALALFQTSSVVTVFLGRALFREPQFARRLLGALIMTAGAAIIVVAR